MRRALFHPSIFVLFVGLASVSVLSGCGDLTKPNDNQIRKDPDVKAANGAPTGVMGAAQGQGAAAKGATGTGATGAQQPANAGPKPSPMVKPVVAPQPQPQANQPSCGG